MVGGFRLFRIRFVSYLEFVVCGFYFGVRVVFAVHIEGGLLEASEGEAEASFEMFGAVGAEDKQLMVEFVHYFHRHCYVGGCRIVALFFCVRGFGCGLREAGEQPALCAAGQVAEHLHE